MQKQINKKPHQCQDKAAQLLLKLSLLLGYEFLWNECQFTTGKTSFYHFCEKEVTLHLWRSLFAMTECTMRILIMKILITWTLSHIRYSNENSSAGEEGCNLSKQPYLWNIQPVQWEQQPVIHTHLFWTLFCTFSFAHPYKNTYCTYRISLDTFVSFVMQLQSLEETVLMVIQFPSYELQS